MDKGVRIGYVDHHFKGTDEGLKTAKASLEGQAKRRFYDSKDAYFAGQKARDTASLVSIQASRPLKPPGKP